MTKSQMAIIIIRKTFEWTAHVWHTKDEKNGKRSLKKGKKKIILLFEK